MDSRDSYLLQSLAKVNVAPLQRMGDYGGASLLEASLRRSAQGFFVVWETARYVSLV